MDYGRHSRSEIQDTVVKLSVGFFGTILAIFLLPRTVKFVIRKFLLGIMGEVVAIVLTGLLAEKAVEQISNE
jgi:hypothetical protein